MNPKAELVYYLTGSKSARSWKVVLIANSSEKPYIRGNEILIGEKHPLARKLK